MLPGQGRGGRGAAIQALMKQRRPGSAVERVGGLSEAMPPTTASTDTSTSRNGAANGSSHTFQASSLDTGNSAPPQMESVVAEGGAPSAVQDSSPKQLSGRPSSPSPFRHEGVKTDEGVVVRPLIAETPSPKVAKGRAAMMAKLMNRPGGPKVGVNLLEVSAPPPTALAPVSPPTASAPVAPLTASAPVAPLTASAPVAPSTASAPVSPSRAATLASLSRAPVEALGTQIEKLNIAAAKVPPQGPATSVARGETQLGKETELDARVVRKGESGRPINVMANYIKLNVARERGLFEHEVRYSPAADSIQIRKQLLRQHTEMIGRVYTFDGVTLYLPHKMPEDVVELVCQHPGDQSAVKLTVSFRREKNLSECVHFYNVLFKRVQEELEMSQIGRNYYFPKLAHAIPAHKLEVWPGYVTAVEEQEGGLMLCCDVSHRVLRTISVLDVLLEKKNESQRRQLNFKELVQKELIGLVVVTKYNNRNYRIDDVEWDQTPKSTFTFYTGEEISYKDYYKKQYNLQIRDENQPLLLNRLTKKRQGEEDKTHLVCLVPELCHITGLSDELRADRKIMKDLSFHTRVSPMARKESLVKYLKLVNETPKARAKLEDWGLSLDLDIINIPGRIIEEEKIFFGANKAFNAGSMCDWSRSACNQPVLTPVNISNWMFVGVERDRGLAERAVEQLASVGQSLGIRVEKPQLVFLNNDRTDTYIAALRKISRETQLVVILFPSSRDDRYSAVKIQLNCLTPCPSQVINSRTISRPDKVRSIMQKIALQINCKLGGELWAVKIPLTNVMICGVDVYHDPSRKRSSVAGFVASMNRDCTRWHSEVSLQKPGHEMMSGLTLCFVRALAEFHKVNGQYPGTIIIYRDGVGDGQLTLVREHEVQQLMTAFESVGTDYHPKFTEVVVQKRINTRIFAQLHSGKLDNPAPGTVVDHTVVRRNWFDFFLVSQHVGQGTVSPTHYVVIKDGGMKVDHLQRLTYKMTHMYYNWPGTVRVPAPCLYAHKLAYLVGEHLRKEPHESLSDRLYYL